MASKRISPDKLFVEDCKSSDETVKQRFIEVSEYKCNCCGIFEWQNKPLTLQLDHINGNHMDCRFENLRLLCPSCHSQTITYAGRQQWANVIVTDDEFIIALKCNSTIRKALQSVKLDTGRTEYFGRATFLIKTHQIIVGSEVTNFDTFFKF